MEKLMNIAFCKHFVYYCFETKAVKLNIEDSFNEDLNKVFEQESNISLEDCQVMCRELNSFELEVSTEFDRTPLHKYFN